MEKLLTIGIAVYNIKEQYLKECIKSAAENILDDTEIIIVDDCSDEYCKKICKKYADESNGSIKYIRNKKNMGIGRVRNIIIQNASGKWISFVDGDDTVSKNLAKSILPLCKKDDIDVILFDYGARNSREDENKTAEFLNISRSTVKLMTASALLRHDLYKKEVGLPLHVGSVWAGAYRTEFLKDNNIFFNENLKIAEDSMFNADVYLNGAKTVFLAQQLYYYRKNSFSVTNRYDKNAKRNADMYLSVIKKYIEDKFQNDKTINHYFLKYRCCRAITDNFERDIFHKDNPKMRKQRKQDFLNLISSEPYKTAIEYTNIKNYENHRCRLALSLAKRRAFLLLEFIYKHDAVFKIYGGMSRRIKQIKNNR